jgi:lipopolysaccharide export LptBFGC system permease protein LptF
MVGAIVAVTILSRTGELNAIKACGISVQRATAPILLATLAICGIYYVAQDKLIPVTSQKSLEIKDQIYGRSPRTYGARPGGSWVFSADGSRLYHYRMFDGDPGFFQALNSFSIDRDAMKVRSHRFGDAVNWVDDAWVHTRGWYRTFPDDGSSGIYRKDETAVVQGLDGPEHFAQRESGMRRNSDSQIEQFDMDSLKAEIQSLRQSGYDTTRLEVSYFGRYSRPLTPLVMVMLGLPFAFRIGRKGSLYGIGVAILLVILYWATFAIFNALGMETILPPFLAAWAPNIFYGLLGASMMLYVRT